MIAITTIAGVLVLVSAAILFVKFAKNTMLTLVTVAGLLIGLLLIFGPANIPGLSDYTNSRAVQDFVPGTGSAAYAPHQINISSMYTDLQGNLIIDLDNTGDLPINDFEISVNRNEPLPITSDIYSLLPGRRISLSADYKPVNGDVVSIIAGGASDSEIFTTKPF